MNSFSEGLRLIASGFGTLTGSLSNLSKQLDDLRNSTQRYDDGGGNFIYASTGDGPPYEWDADAVTWTSSWSFETYGRPGTKDVPSQSCGCDNCSAQSGVQHTDQQRRAIALGGVK